MPGSGDHDTLAREILRRDLGNPLWPGLTESEWAADAKVIASDYLALAARVAALEHALREIVDQDGIELALDPAWSQRIARDALTKADNQ